MNNKAQSISINTIVVAAIALTVMILVILITTGSLGNFRRSADQCEANGGVCISVDEIDEKCGDPDYDIIRGDYVCYSGRDPDPNKVCCVST
ncbi:TPA: hypothetical protein HA239_04095 [Candidatus Woesearchaeota archaeon]|nr:hypothetical protein QT06_C0001G0763 [archaeon GW2011_AR15]MBS3103456.1 hypothetical protein [Candidatus Woesearchaeota archaeon]HIH41574.1 hypothetical protein [Candidatus Woesearchaeota archaeon]